MKREPDIEREEQLIAKIRSGETDRYRDVVERFNPMIFHIVRRYVRDDEEQVQELVQEIFVMAWERLEQFDGRSKFSTWLFTLASNRCRDYVKNIRRKNSRISEHDPDFLDRHWQDEETPVDRIERAERMDELNRALEQLGPEMAEPLLLKVRDGCSYEVISERLGISVGALKVRVHRARKELQRLLSRTGPTGNRDTRS